MGGGPVAMGGGPVCLGPSVMLSLASVGSVPVNSSRSDECGNLV